MIHKGQEGGNGSTLLGSSYTICEVIHSNFKVHSDKVKMFIMNSTAATGAKDKAENYD